MDETNGTIPHENEGTPTSKEHEYIPTSEELTEGLAELKRKLDEWGRDGVSWRTQERKIDEWAGNDPLARRTAEHAKRQTLSNAQYFGLGKMASRLDNLGKVCAMVVRVFEGGYGHAGRQFYEAADILGVDSPEWREELGLRDVSAAWALFSLALSNASERLNREAKREHFRASHVGDDFGSDDIPF